MLVGRSHGDSQCKRPEEATATWEAPAVVCTERTQAATSGVSLDAAVTVQHSEPFCHPSHGELDTVSAVTTLLSLE